MVTSTLSSAYFIFLEELDIWYLNHSLMRQIGGNGNVHLFKCIVLGSRSSIPKQSVSPFWNLLCGTLWEMNNWKKHMDHSLFPYDRWGELGGDPCWYNEGRDGEGGDTWWDWSWLLRVRVYKRSVWCGMRLVRYTGRFVGGLGWRVNLFFYLSHRSW